MQAEYKPYFDALEKHPRLLVGTQVPKIGGAEGEMETLQSSDDAREWQEAVKSILVPEIKARAQTKLDASRDYLETLHSSVDLFLKNRDLIPGTPRFNQPLADAFAEMAQPYELRVDGKLRGYSIPVQPLIDSLRKQLAVAPSQPSAPQAPAGGSAPGPSTPPVDPPQAGIPSKAGATAGQAEDFSTLFGTIGLPNLKI